MTMHPKVEGAIQEIDAALFNGDTFDNPDDRAELMAYVERWARALGLTPSAEGEPDEAQSELSEGWKLVGAVSADFIRAQLRHPSALAPVRVRTDGSWRDAAGVVHAVNATWIEPDVDLGRETACGSASWDPDNSHSYPVATDAVVDCMTCVVRQARSCL